jgi:hypothetical protein
MLFMVDICVQTNKTTHQSEGRKSERETKKRLEVDKIVSKGETFNLLFLYIALISAELK